jgi:hypothetical protein
MSDQVVVWGAPDWHPNKVPQVRQGVLPHIGLGKRIRIPPLRIAHICGIVNSVLSVATPYLECVLVEV